MAAGGLGTAGDEQLPLSGRNSVPGPFRAPPGLASGGSLGGPFAGRTSLAAQGPVFNVTRFQEFMGRVGAAPGPALPESRSGPARTSDVGHGERRNSSVDLVTGGTASHRPRVSVVTIELGLVPRVARLSTNAAAYHARRSLHALVGARRSVAAPRPTPYASELPGDSGDDDADNDDEEEDDEEEDKEQAMPDLSDALLMEASSDRRTKFWCVPPHMSLLLRTGPAGAPSGPPPGLISDPRRHPARRKDTKKKSKMRSAVEKVKKQFGFLHRLTAQIQKEDTRPVEARTAGPAASPCPRRLPNAPSPMGASQQEGCRAPTVQARRSLITVSEDVRATVQTEVLGAPRASTRLPAAARREAHAQPAAQHAA